MSQSSSQPITLVSLPDGGSSGSGSSGSSSSANGRYSFNSKILTQQISRLREEFENTFGRHLPRSIESEMRREIAIFGSDWRYYLYAIREAAAAPRPSWLYARAVYKRVAIARVNPEELCFFARDDGTILYDDEA